MSITNERPTPETDAAIADGHTFNHEDLRPVIALCQKLERERDEAVVARVKAMRETLRNAEAELSVTTAERDDFRRKMIDLEEHVAKLKLERSELWVEIAAAKHGDSGYAVLQERHEKQLEAMRTAIKGADRSLSDLVEHIGECEERDLLRCDSDPHPPSVFSVYAQQASASLAKLKPFLP